MERHEKTTTWFHFYVESRRVQLKETIEKWLPGARENRERLVKEYRLSAVRGVRSEGLTYNHVLVGNTAVELKFTKRTTQMFSHTGKGQYVK